MNIALLGDVGRDQVRFGLIDLDGTGAAYSIEIMSVKDHLTFTDAIIAYLKKVDRVGQIRQLALAVAGVSRGDSVSATNGGWRLSISGLAHYLSVKPVVLNDFAASAFALKSLPQTAFRPVGLTGASRPAADANFALIGPLGGLGVAGLLSQGGHDFIVQSEAGHNSLAPVNQDAQEFLASLRKTQRATYVEHMLSEDGLRRCYSFFSNNGSTEVSPVSTAQIIGQMAAEPAAKAAVDLFALQLAAFSRDVLTAFGAWDGLYFSGPLANTLAGKISDPAFRSQFAENHSYSRLLREVPIGIVIEPDLVLTGLAGAVRQRFGQHP